ncbi:hypothetical protein MMC31_007041 [Peltigera leucophlebia]|nr:hypothetical protein [Peltigera leucophlebia]
MKFFVEAVLLVSLFPLAQSQNLTSGAANTSIALPSPSRPFQLSSRSSGGTISGTGGFLSSSAIRTGPQSVSTVVAPLPLPSFATIITGTVGSQVVTETFFPHIFSQYTTISGTITTTTTLTPGSSPVTVVVGPSGIGWVPYHEPSGAPELLPPSIIPPSAVAAAADLVDSAAASVSSPSMPLGTGVSSPSVPLGTGISTSDSLAITSSHPIGTRISSPSVPLGTGVSAPSLSSSRISLGAGFSGSSLSSIGSNAQSLLTGSTSTFRNISQTTQPASISKSASPGFSTTAAIVPISYVTTAFNNPSQTITTLSISGQAAIVYNKETFPALSTITAPTTIQTSVVKTEKDGKTSTFIGGIVVGPGGIYWGPPGLPSIPPFPGILPPCIWPFCTGGGGGGGSDPPGDPQPPPPYKPDDPNTPDSNNPKTQDQPSDKSSKPSSTQYPSSLSSPSSASQSSSVTSTTASACPLGAFASPDPTMAGFDYSNEYPVLNPGYSSNVQWTYTVADIVESGVVIGDISVGPSDSASSRRTTGIITPTGAGKSATPGSGASTIPTPTAAAKPTGDCAFWDEALYWRYEVYNINGWAGNDGDGLHKEEKGCGDLTGWSWTTTGDIGNDQHAYFNLPYLIQSGCVERAIASAGGPSGLSCSWEGIGKKRRSLKLGPEQKNSKRRRRFRTDVSFSPPNRGIELQALQNFKREALLEIKPPSIVERDITPAPKRLNARSEFDKLYVLDSRDLVKRGCLDWLWPGKNIPEEWWCNAVIPGVDACIAEIQKKGVVGKYPSMFYTSWGGIGDGSFGVQGTKLWASQNICTRVVDFDGITVVTYHYAVESAVLKPFGKDGLNLPEDEQKQILDPFLKNLSQAFAEQSAGEAYVFVPKVVDFQPNSAWTGWEYPALTRNDQITKIWKVELDYSDPSQFQPPNGKPQGVKTVLWTKGDPPSAIEPKGTRRGTLPAQIPQEHLPANWQDSI